MGITDNMDNMTGLGIFGKKAISEIISVVLVVLMGIALVSTAYMWGMPMISKKQDTIEIERLYSYFDRTNSNSLVKKIEFIAKNGGEDTFVSGVDGLWVLHEHDEGGEDANSLEFTTFSKVSNIAISDPDTGIEWVALTPGGSCPPGSGMIGLDPSYVVCAKAEPVSDGFGITYKVLFREVYEATGTKSYKINLVKHQSGQTSSSSESIKISRGSVTSQVQGGKTLIITEIKILLV